MTDTTHKLENTSEFQTWQSLDGEKNVYKEWEICSLCKVGATGELETDVLGSEVEVMLSLWNEFIRVMSWKLNQSFIDKFIEKWWIPPKLRLDNVIDS